MNRLTVAAAGACVSGAVLLRRAADRLTDLGLWIEQRGGMDTAVRLVADGEDLTPDELVRLTAIQVTCPHGDKALIASF